MNMIEILTMALAKMNGCYWFSQLTVCVYDVFLMFGLCKVLCLVAVLYNTNKLH